MRSQREFETWNSAPIKKVNVTLPFVADVKEKFFLVEETQQTVRVCMKQHSKLQNCSMLHHILKKERRQVYQPFYCINCGQGIIEVWSAERLKKVPMALKPVLVGYGRVLMP